ncbi:MAG: hypothetical protein RLZZ28_472 [Bacteroidota bacterium]|jgi:membrane associated rhomboid family serine protease
MLTITLIILLITCVVSFTAFSNDKITGDMIFSPVAVSRHNQWYRFFSCGLIHADFMHLAFNMYTFYLFGGMVEQAFTEFYGGAGKSVFTILYFSSLAISILPTYFRHKNDYHYHSLGASGAVSAVIFVGIFLNPTMGMGIFPIPFHIPAFIFGPLFLLITAYLAKKGGGNINHSAHLWGALYGIVYLIVTSQFLSSYRPLAFFLSEVAGYFR